MNNNSYKKICGLLLVFCGCSPLIYGINNQDITNMYSSYIEEWQSKASKSFDLAESEILIKPNPQPKPDQVIDPDPAKCICKGSGVIVQGDDHKTPCPYHYKGNSQTLKSIIKKWG